MQRPPVRSLATLLTLPLLASSLASAQGVTLRQPIAIKARIASGSGLGVEAELPLSSRWRATVGLTRSKVMGGAKYFLPGNNYLAGSLGFNRGGLTDVSALVGHRFDTSSVFFDVEGGLNLKQLGPVIGASVGIRL